jgi:SAM-dependent methyltransferase
MSLDYFSLDRPILRPIRQVRSAAALRARTKMYQQFMHLSMVSKDAKVLDVGATPDQTLPESNHFEQLYPWPSQVTAISIEDVSCLQSNFPNVSFAQVSTLPWPFDDQQFDALHCSAVLEHVGDGDHQRAFIAECLRVSKFVFFTTPNRWFPIEFHTLLPLVHWLPQSIHQAILRLFGYEFLSKTENLNLLTSRSLSRLFPEHIHVQISTHKLLGWSSNLVASTSSSNTVKCDVTKSLHSQ